MTTQLTLTVLPLEFSICRLFPSEAVPSRVLAASFYSITRTSDELSIVCPTECVPEGVHCDSGWRNVKIEGPLDFSLTGVLKSLADPLAEAGISIFAVSTYETDYLLVKEFDLDRAVAALSNAGHLVSECADAPGRDL